MESMKEINPNVLSLILHHSSTTSSISILNSPISSREQRVQLKKAQIKHLKIPTAFKVKSGQLRPAKYISIYDFTVPLPSTFLKCPPTSSAFFTIYNSTKSSLEYHAYCENIRTYVTDCLAVYMGHTASCLVRVPVDVTRQNRPANPGLNTFQLVNKLLHTRGIGGQLGRQLATIFLREIPFCSIKFPFWETLKISFENKGPDQNKTVETYKSAVFGGMSGGMAAALTTPVDLAWKRVYVDKIGGYKRFKILFAIRDMAREKGLKGLFVGVQQRVPMVGFGGFLFFWCYEQKRRFLFEED